MSPIEPSSRVADLASSQSIPVIHEALNVETRVVDGGGYRITKQVTVSEETVDELLRAQDVSIERVSLGRLLPTMERQEPVNTQAH